MIHRDLKPQNVLLTRDSHPKITDFGLARITDEPIQSVSGEFAGTYLYCSPEQVMARRAAIDHRTDVFSLGIVLYELLALRRPFEGDTPSQVGQQILDKDPPDPRTFRSRVPRDLTVVVGKALEKDRARRFQTMKEFALELRRYLAGEPIWTHPPSSWSRARTWMRRHPTAGATLVITAIALLIILLLLVQLTRTPHHLQGERSRLAQSNLALEAKTAEAEDNAAFALEQEALIVARLDEVQRLSALQELDDLTSEADELWPAYPQNIPRFEAWIARAEKVAEELPAFEHKLRELLAGAKAWSQEEREAARAAHPRYGELECSRRHLKFLQDQAAGYAADGLEDPTPAEVGLDLASLPRDPVALNALASPLVDPERSDWGEEAKGLVLARRALELATTDASRALVRRTLSWALFAAGRFDEAIAESERANAEDPRGAHLDELLEEIVFLVTPEGVWKGSTSRVDMEIEWLEAVTEPAPRWSFDDPLDEWWSAQLVKLVQRLREFADPVDGLLSDGLGSSHGCGVQRRLLLARALKESEADHAHLWARAMAAIRDPAQCPLYDGLVISPQVGLLPLGQDGSTGLWEFAHLPSGEPARRGKDGQLILEEATGLVLVLLPGGTFWMGAQPLGTNSDFHAEEWEGPVHSVTLAPFFLSKYEMTQEQWWRVAGHNPSRVNPTTSRPSWSQGEPEFKLHPVEQVSWRDCVRMLFRLGLSLPTEAQWEFGARGGTTTTWWTGHEKQELTGAANLSDLHAGSFNLKKEIERWLDDGKVFHGRVGSFRPNGFGLHDVCGNLWEWCLDQYGTYRLPTRPGDGERLVSPAQRRNYFQERFQPLFALAESHVLRGGSFNSMAVDARSASRDEADADRALETFGVRPARELTR